MFDFAVGSVNFGHWFDHHCLALAKRQEELAPQRYGILRTVKILAGADGYDLAALSVGKL
jgi:hypothetical protein